MKLNERIKEIRKELGLSVKDIYRIQKAQLGKDALSYMTILRIEKGAHIKFSSIIILCNALGVSLLEIFKNTEFENKILIKKHERTNSFTPNDKVTYEAISGPSCDFLSMEAHFLPGGHSPVERDPSSSKHEKVIYVVSGRLSVFIDDKKYELGVRDSLTFNSSANHYYINESKRKCIATITQYPRYY